IASWRPPAGPMIYGWRQWPEGSEVSDDE
ncbi:MAG: hypothetical protein RJB61_2456, partial [Actinomycetota bacterium]